MTDQQQPRPPLWRVLADSYDDAFNGGIRDAGAAQIRTVADWLVPEEDELPDILKDFNSYHRCQMRRELRQRLLEEAQRAEAGE